jgi:hypothetical protein
MAYIEFIIVTPTSLETLIFAATHCVSPTRASRTKNETTTDSQMPFAMQLCIILVFVENMSDSRRDRKRGHTFDMGSVR